MSSRQSLRGICGGALRPVARGAVNHVEIGSQVISPGAGARDEGQEQLRKPICLSLSSYEHRVFTDRQLRPPKGNSLMYVNRTTNENAVR